MVGSSALKAIPELKNTMSFFPVKSVSTHALESHLSTQACKNYKQISITEGQID